MPTPDREDLHLIGQATDLPAPAIRQALEAHVYRDKQAWQRFLPLFFLALGIGFTASGILFFFAYNWASLHKFVKIGLIEGLLVLAILAVLLTKLSPVVKKALLTGAAVLVGVLLAVFGQVYQTGADAYDLFAAWTLAITLWVVVSHFAPLWLLYILLCNVTAFLFMRQVEMRFTDLLQVTVLFLVNAVFALAGLLLEQLKPAVRLPGWSVKVVVLAAVTFGTLAGIVAITDYNRAATVLLFVLTYLPATVAGIWMGLQRKQLFYLCVLPFSLIVLAATCLLRQSSDMGMIFVVLVFVMASTGGLIWWLINLQKKFAHENAG